MAINGARALITTLVDAGVTVCFANPGTSEMHFVAALDSEPRMRAVLCLFEGVVTGAADGYARMTGQPAATLLHLGPGLGNGLANLHNARRANSPVVNIVGDHATYHKPFDAPLESDIDALAGAVSGWVRRSTTAADVGPDAAAAVAFARFAVSRDDATDITDAIDITDITDADDVLEVAVATVATDADDVLEVADATVATDVDDVIEVADASVATDVREVADASVATDVGEVTDPAEANDAEANDAEANGAAGGTDDADVIKTIDPNLAGGRVATLILPADSSWSDGGEPAAVNARSEPSRISDSVIDDLAQRLSSGVPATILLGGSALGEPGLRAAARIARATGARLLIETFPARMRRGAGLPDIQRLAYREEDAAAQLRGTELLLLAGARRPVAFFAYPGRPSEFTPPGAHVSVLAAAGSDVPDALIRLADALSAGDAPTVPAVTVPPGGAPTSTSPAAAEADPPSGRLTAGSMARVIGALLPNDAIICDESNTSGGALPAATAGSPPHDVLTLTGGAIGIGLPLAVGAAVACPDRPVICVESDGSAMYTISALWTHAREDLNITTIICNNHSYAILQYELNRVGAQGGDRAAQLLDLSRPDLDFVALSTGMGVPATRATNAAEFADQFRRAIAEPGPHLIEATMT